jgi:nitric oxide reductase subunit B
VATTDGRTILDRDTIQRGQNVWQSIGGQEVGSIWGHGSYLAPDWTADWLHREATFILDRWAKEAPAGAAATFASLPPEAQAALRARLEGVMRTNTYDPASGVLIVDPVRVEAFDALAIYYQDIFTTGRDEYAIPKGAQTDPQKARDMAAFFFWSSQRS